MSEKASRVVWIALWLSFHDSGFRPRSARRDSVTLPDMVGSGVDFSLGALAGASSSIADRSAVEEHCGRGHRSAAFLEQLPRLQPTANRRQNTSTSDNRISSFASSGVSRFTV